MFLSNVSIDKSNAVCALATCALTLMEYPPLMHVEVIADPAKRTVRPIGAQAPVTKKELLFSCPIQVPVKYSVGSELIEDSEDSEEFSDEAELTEDIDDVSELSELLESLDELIEF